MSVVTGGPGCGKSFAVRILVDIVEAAGGRAGLATPTGRAAKRLTELTWRSATAVHRLIYGRREDPPRPVSLCDAYDPLDADLIVVDEASMLDVKLFAQLLGKGCGCRGDGRPRSPTPGGRPGGRRARKCRSAPAAQ
ncbi:AAA family ATPase [Kitasatospora herbaricolor]|uniref:AAA family ATPase n=1 Tax=Kitasatospora herbaricolor TaxID=68217 RepID=A0ABZ1W249_9ACTN|nr:AAA family ATPase [Kitasatospora herbaricolor]